jgi:streptogramin lyase
VTVAADVHYSESVVPISLDSTPTGLSVAPNGDLYIVTKKGLQTLAKGSTEPRTLVADIPSALGFVVTDKHAIVGYIEKLEIVDLADNGVEERAVANIGDIWGIAADLEDNVYLTGEGRPDGRVIKMNSELSDPVDVPFPGLNSNASIAVGPGGDVYVVDYFKGEITVVRPGKPAPELLDLKGAQGPTRVAASPAGDLFVLVNDHPGSFSTAPAGLTLLRYPVGGSAPVELAKYVTNAYQIAAGADGNVYYVRSQGEGYQLMKLSPQP